MQVPLDVRLKYISPLWTPEQALAAECRTGCWAAGGCTKPRVVTCAHLSHLCNHRAHTTALAAGSCKFDSATVRLPRATTLPSVPGFLLSHPCRWMRLRQLLEVSSSLVFWSIRRVNCVVVFKPNQRAKPNPPSSVI